MLPKGSSFKKFVSRLPDGISNVSERVGKVGGYGALCLLIGVMSFEVIMRYGFNRPNKYTIEIALFLQLLAVAFAAAYILKEGGHINIVFLVDKFPTNVRNWVLSIASIVGALFSGFMSLQLWLTAAWNVHVNMVAEMLEIPIAPFQFALVAGFALMGLQFLVQSYEYYKLTKKGNDFAGVTN